MTKRKAWTKLGIYVSPENARDRMVLEVMEKLEKEKGARSFSPFAKQAILQKAHREGLIHMPSIEEEEETT